MSQGAALAVAALAPSVASPRTLRLRRRWLPRCPAQHDLIADRATTMEQIVGRGGGVRREEGGRVCACGSEEICGPTCRRRTVMSIPTLDVRTTDMSLNVGEVAVFDLLLSIHGFAHDRPVRRRQEQRAA
jgi:hypothetical protein